MSIRIRQSRVEQERLDQLEQEFLSDIEEENYENRKKYIFKRNEALSGDLTKQEEQELSQLLEEFEFIY